MSDPTRSARVVAPSYGSRAPMPRESGGNLGDILERVLDRGVVIVGDIRVNLLDIELLTIKLRLLIASVDTARELGIDWWEHDPWLSSKDRDLAEENRRLRRRLAAAGVEAEAEIESEIEAEERGHRPIERGRPPMERPRGTGAHDSGRAYHETEAGRERHRG